MCPSFWLEIQPLHIPHTEAVNMYARSIDIPMLAWIDAMLGFVQRMLSFASDEEQFQAMVVTAFVLFEAGYFLGLSKCFLIPEQHMTYLGIDFDIKNNKFFVPEKRIMKYLPILQEML